MRSRGHDIRQSPLVADVIARGMTIGSTVNMSHPGISSFGSSAADQGLDRHARHRQATRARLMAAGRRLIGAQGFASVAVASITEEADVGVGSFYNYFRSKAELLDVVIAEVAALLGEVLEGLTAGRSDPAERVAVCVRYVVRLTRHDPTWAWFVLRASDAVPRVVTSVVAPIEPHVRAGMGAGRFVVEDPAMAVEAVGGLLLHAMRATLLRGGEPYDGDRVAAEQVLRVLGLDRESAHAIATSALAEHAGRHDGVSHPTNERRALSHGDRASAGTAARRRRALRP